MVVEIRSVTVKVTIDTNKYTHTETFEIHDLEEDLEKVKECIERHIAQAG